MFEPKPAAPAQGTAIRRGSRLRKAFCTGVLGMGAEILFACGLTLIGFAISLLSGW